MQIASNQIDERVPAKNGKTCRLWSARTDTGEMDGGLIESIIVRQTQQRLRFPYRLSSGRWGIFGLVLLGVIMILLIWSLRQYHRGPVAGPAVRSIIH